MFGHFPALESALTTALLQLCGLGRNVYFQVCHVVEIHNSRAYCHSVTAKQQQCQSQAPAKENGLDRISFTNAGMLLCPEQAWKGQKDPCSSCSEAQGKDGGCY